MDARRVLVPSLLAALTLCHPARPATADGAPTYCEEFAAGVGSSASSNPVWMPADRMTTWSLMTPQMSVRGVTLPPLGIRSVINDRYDSQIGYVPTSRQTSLNLGFYQRTWGDNAWTMKGVCAGNPISAREDADEIRRLFTAPR